MKTTLNQYWYAFDVVKKQISLTSSKLLNHLLSEMGHLPAKLLGLMFIELFKCRTWV